MNKRTKIIATALLTIAIIGVAYCAVTLWFREPTMLVQYKYYTATLCNARDRASIVQRVSVNSWTIDPTNDHIWELALVIDEMNQVDTGCLVLNSTVPNTLSINVSSVDVYYMQYVAGVVYDTPMLIANLATNVPLGTEIAISKAQVLSTSMPSDPARIVFLWIRLSEYQTAPTTETNVLVPTTVSLGVSSF